MLVVELRLEENHLRRSNEGLVQPTLFEERGMTVRPGAGGWPVDGIHAAHALVLDEHGKQDTAEVAGRAGHDDDRRRPQLRVLMLSMPESSAASAPKRSRLSSAACSDFGDGLA
jgi:hypothetical protein